MTIPPPPPFLDAVLFDFDGTLMDASEAICASFRIALQPHGISLSDGEIRALIGRPLRDMFSSVVPEASEEQLQSLVAAYRAAFFPLADQKTAPLPGALALIDQLRTTHALGIVTTRSSTGAVRMLRQHGLLDSFGTVVALDHVTHPKPHPEPVLTALRQLSVSPRRALMVGDTTDDIHAGKSAGTWTCGVTTGSHGLGQLRDAGADIVVTSLHELGQWLELGRS